MTGDPAPAPEPRAVLRITPEELAAVAIPATPPALPGQRDKGEKPPLLAAPALILALRGIPLGGLLLGPLAIVCGAIALGSSEIRTGTAGYRMALTAVIVGVVDLLLWTAVLIAGIAAFHFLPGPDAPPIIVDDRLSPAVGGIDEAPAPIRRALRANITIRCGDTFGSGVAIARDPEGYFALTNHHVARCAGGETGLTAAVLGGEDVPAVVTWTAPEGIDAALIRVAGEPGALPEPVPVRSDTLPAVGDAVFAVGNPLGYEASYTAGVLSGIRPSHRDGGVQHVLQVQVSLNPGNSGGGVYDSDGRLIGINTWIAKQPLAGIGFSLAARDLAALLRADGGPEPTIADGGSRP